MLNRKRKAVQAVIRSRDLVLLVKKPDLKTGELRLRLLKGGARFGEKDRRALKREIREEVGLKNIQIGRRVHSYHYTDAFGKAQKVTSYVVWADSKESIKIGRELRGALWLYKSKALKKLVWPEEKTALKKAFGELK